MPFGVQQDNQSSIHARGPVQVATDNKLVGSLREWDVSLGGKVVVPPQPGMKPQVRSGVLLWALGGCVGCLRRITPEGTQWGCAATLQPLSGGAARVTQAHPLPQTAAHLSRWFAGSGSPKSASFSGDSGQQPLNHRPMQAWLHANKSTALSPPSETPQINGLQPFPPPKPYMGWIIVSC